MPKCVSLGSGCWGLGQLGGSGHPRGTAAKKKHFCRLSWGQAFLLLQVKSFVQLVDSFSHSFRNFGDFRQTMYYVLGTQTKLT